MALDRPANPPDRPEVPDSADVPADPHGVANLTRAEAFKSHRYWSEVERFSDVSDRLADRWRGVRDEESLAPREHDVSPEQRREAAESVRNIADGEPLISDAVLAVASQCPYGAQLTGFEHRRKGEARLLEKALDVLEAQPDATAEEIVKRIPDAVRYTICFETGDYVSGYLDTKDRLETSGFAMYYSKNSWDDPEYKGVNSRWITPEGQRFEVQFHTRESFHAKHEVTHLAYERLRGAQATRGERADLRALQREVSAHIPVPDRVTEITDYKREGF